MEKEHKDLIELLIHDGVEPVVDMISEQCDDATEAAQFCRLLKKLHRRYVENVDGKIQCIDDLEYKDGLLLWGYDPNPSDEVIEAAYKELALSWSYGIFSIEVMKRAVEGAYVFTYSNQDYTVVVYTDPEDGSRSYGGGVVLTATHARKLWRSPIPCQVKTTENPIEIDGTQFGANGWCDLVLIYGEDGYLWGYYGTEDINAPSAVSSWRPRDREELENLSANEENSSSWGAEKNYSETPGDVLQEVLEEITSVKEYSTRELLTELKRLQQRCGNLISSLEEKIDIDLIYGLGVDLRACTKIQALLLGREFSQF